MGLDIFLYNLEPSSFNKKDFDNFETFYKFISKNKLFVFEDKEIENISNKDSLKRISVEVKISGEELDEIKLRDFLKRKGINKSPTYAKKEGNKVVIDLIHQETVEFDIKEADEFFVKEEKILYYCKKEEVAYQRGTTEIGWRALDFIGNCNYSDAFNILRNMVFEKALDEIFLKNFTENSIFCAWW